MLVLKREDSFNLCSCAKRLKQLKRTELEKYYAAA